MPPTRPRPEPGVATTQELLQAALARSARRNARVAQMRVAGRWVLWALGQSFRGLGIAALVAAPFVIGWQAWKLLGAESTPAVAAAPPAAPSAVPATTMVGAAAPAAPGVDAAASGAVSAAIDPEGPAASASPPYAPAASGPASDARSLRLRLDDSVTPGAASGAAQSAITAPQQKPDKP